MTTTGGTAGPVFYGAPVGVEVKAAGDGWRISGYASTWDTDLMRDRIEPGAFKRSLASGRKVRFLFGHDHTKPLGVTKSLREDATGLFGDWVISQTQLGADVRQLVFDGALDSFSIGFVPKDYTLDRDGVRVLKDVELVEVSLVAMPANPGATVSSIKTSASAGGVAPSGGGHLAAFLARQEGRRWAQRQAQQGWLEDQREQAAFLRRRLSLLTVGGR